ncbi:MAG: hypothetical protein HY904_02610 [Deltaproteobacteria bacterium]|nr:hypothetical protein [Deltaproteobacteria bacterium]
MRLPCLLLCVPLVLATAALGCTEGDGGGTSSSGSSGTSGTSGSSGTSSSSSGSSSSSSGAPQVDCNSPAGSTTLCDIQKGAVTPLTEVTLPHPVIVTSDVFVLSTSNNNVKKAFFVLEEPGGPYRGGLVYGEAAVVEGLTLTPGSQVILQVIVEEYTGTGAGSETQLKLVGGNVVGSTAVPAATAVSASTFSSDVAAEAYEGLLITVSGVTAQRFSSGAIMEYGAFLVEGGLRVDDLFYRHAVGAGETFSSITGFIRYSYDGYWNLEPRNAADIVSSGNPRTYADVDVTQVQDPANITALPHCIAPAECDPIRLTNMVVTGVPRIADKDANGVATLYHVFVQDPSKLDVNNEPLPYSAVKIVFARTGLTSNLAFNTYGTNNDLPDTDQNPDGWPMPGDVITVEGSIQEYFDMTQVGNVRTLNRVGRVTDSPSPIPAVPNPKSFTGDTALAGLAAGAKGLAECSYPSGGAGADVEKWEGALVKLVSSTTTLACVPTVTNSTAAPACTRFDFGYFQVTGGVEVGTGQGSYFSGRCASTSCVCPNETGEHVPSDTRVLGKAYPSITGIFDYSFEVFRVNPRRNMNDVVE